MTEQTLVAPHIAMKDTARGLQPYIADKGFKVRMLAGLHLREGLSPAEIVEDYGLTLAEVHAGLSYYYDHQAEIDALLDEDEALVRELEPLADKVQ